MKPHLPHAPQSAPNHSRNAAFFLAIFLSWIVCGCARPAKEDFVFADEGNPLALPAVGTNALRVLSPTVLELTLITTKPLGGPVGQWNFVNDAGKMQLPPTGDFQVAVAGKPVAVEAVGFKRRPLYAPLRKRDLRIDNWLYLRLAQPLAENAAVEVKSAHWPAALRFATANSALRWSPAIHVNQVGYDPAQTKRAIVGHYLGSLGELPLPAAEFAVLDLAGKRVFSGPLAPRKDDGYSYSVKPYQQVCEADFTAWKTPGQYRLQVPGLGVSFPFRIADGTASVFARTYALGLYHQRCGVENEFPYTRFTHAPCHVAPAEVPTAALVKTQAKIAAMSGNYTNNSRHTAPQLKGTAASLYPFVNQGKVAVAGGHHDAGDYSKYTINSAQLVHYLVFGADALPGVAQLDNLGLPESGDGKSDILQIAKVEADFLAKMQDADGGFYFLVYPRDRSYEDNVLPDHGDPQVVFPKTTSVTAAATAALAQIASSPAFRKQFPEAAAGYLVKARKGWEFLQRALAAHGRAGAYQKITHYGDTFMHDDELAWAATEIYLATGDPSAHAQLLKTFDPASRDTIIWGWVRMSESYGCAMRSYAFAAKSGRVAPEKLDVTHRRKCDEQILQCGRNGSEWARANAYGTSFPLAAKRFRNAGWYFSIPVAFDMAVALQLGGDPSWKDDVLSNVNYEAGTNPNNMAFLTGIGWQRQREIVHQYALNDRRVLPPTGIPLGAVQAGFPYLDNYKKDLGLLTFPSDGDKDNAYPFYDRWGDTFNTSTEFVIVTQARGLATAAWLMAGTPQAQQKWRAAPGKITGVAAEAPAGTMLTARLQVDGLDLSEAQIVWEAAGEEPRFGRELSYTPLAKGAQWIEAEALWPDGRRAFAAFEFKTK